MFGHRHGHGRDVRRHSRGMLGFGGGRHGGHRHGGGRGGRFGRFFEHGDLRYVLLGLIAEVAPALAAGNTVVAILSEAKPLAGLDLAEVLGVSDVPGGVVNLLSGRRTELATALGAHRDLNAIADAGGDPELVYVEERGGPVPTADDSLSARITASRESK